MVDIESAEGVLTAARTAVATGVQTFVLCMASLGGHPGRAQSIGTLLAGMPFTFVTFNVGMVASAANTIYLMGEQRRAIPSATFSFHPATGGASQASPDELEEQAQSLRLADEAEAQLIKERTGKTIKAARALSAERRQFNAREALSFGIVTEVCPFVIPPGAMLLNS